MLKSQRAASAAVMVILDALSLFVAFAAAWALRDSLGNFLVALGDTIHVPFRAMVRTPEEFRANPTITDILLSKNPLSNFNHFLWLFWVSLPLWLFFLRNQHGYDMHEPRSGRQLLAVCTYAGFLATGVLVIFLFLAKFNSVSRLLITNFLFFGIFSLWLGRMVTLPLLTRRGKEAGRKIILIGHRAAALRFAQVLSTPSYRWSHFLGYVSDELGNCEPSTSTSESPQRLGCLGDLETLLDGGVIDEVVIVRSTADAVQETGENNRRWSHILERCLERGRTVSLFDDLVPPVNAKIEAAMMGSMPMLVLHNTPQNPLSLAIKTTMDRTVALLALIVLAIPFAIVATLIKLHDRGPVFFAQDRVGLNGRIFKFWKFRSMHIDAQNILETMRQENRAHYDEINVMEEPFFKAKDGDDPRITPIGRFIRKYSIDELPQFYNVLKGEMSLVGPRPPLPKEVAELKPWHRRKLSVKGGLTCTWQATGRNDITDVDEWMRLDLEYIDNWSLWLDVKLLFKTLKVLVKPRGAS